MTGRNRIANSSVVRLVSSAPALVPFQRITAILFLLLGFAAMPTLATKAATPDSVEARREWRKLASLPDPEGFAGSFAGVTGRALLVAGGANFPSKKPWEGGAKIWSDKVFLLDRPNGHWKVAGKLPRPLGYGASITTSAGVVCIGGSDSERHYSEVFLIAAAGDTLQFKPLPRLPQACANLCGALLGDVIYVAGGIAEPGSKKALRTFSSLDLRKPQAGWQQHEPWPGRERMLAIAAAHDNSFFLFSGAALNAGEDGRPVREWLRDAYRYTPGVGWEKLRDLPRAAVAAPSPSFARDDKLLVLGGDDGSQVSTPPNAHIGFPRDVLAYDPQRDEWSRVEELPFGLVTTTAVRWDQNLVIPGGEIRPGIRSTEVWTHALN